MENKTFEKAAEEGKVKVTETLPTPKPVVSEYDIAELKAEIVVIQAQIDKERQKYIDQAEWEIAKRKDAKEVSNSQIEYAEKAIIDIQTIIDGAVAVGVKEVVVEAPVDAPVEEIIP